MVENANVQLSAIKTIPERTVGDKFFPENSLETPIRLTDQQLVVNGSEGVITSVNAVWLHKNGLEEASTYLIHKKLTYPEEAETLQQIWLHAKNGGLPTPATFRITKDAETPTGILMTDWSERGKYLALSTGEDHIISRIKKNPTWEKEFKQIKVDNSSSLVRTLYSYADLATDCGLLFNHHDSLFLIVKGGGEIGYADYGNTIVFQENTNGIYTPRLQGHYAKQRQGKNMSKDEIRTNNLDTVKRFRFLLEEAQRDIELTI